MTFKEFFEKAQALAAEFGHPRMRVSVSAVSRMDGALVSVDSEIYADDECFEGGSPEDALAAYDAQYRARMRVSPPAEVVIDVLGEVPNVVR